MAGPSLAISDLHFWVRQRACRGTQARQRQGNLSPRKRKNASDRIASIRVPNWRPNSWKSSPSQVDLNGAKLGSPPQHETYRYLFGASFISLLPSLPWGGPKWIILRLSPKPKFEHYFSPSLPFPFRLSLSFPLSSSTHGRSPKTRCCSSRHWLSIY